MSKLNIIARWGFQKIKGSPFVRSDIHLKMIDYINAFVPALLVIALALVVYEFGFKPFWGNYAGINFWLRIIITIVPILSGIRIFLELFVAKKRIARIFNFMGFLFAVFLTFYILPQKASFVNTDSNRFLFFKLVLYGGILL